MNKKTKTFFYNPWFVGFAFLILSVALPAIYNRYISGYDFKTSLKMVFKFIGGILSLGIPLWLIIIVLIIARLIFKFLKASVGELNPEWWYYRKDEFNARLSSDGGDEIPIPFQNPKFDEVRAKGMKVLETLLFKWKYYRNSDGEYSITDITPICKNCECTLIRENPWFLTCPNCQQEYLLPRNFDYQEVEKKVKTLIMHKANSGAFKNSFYFKKSKL